MNKQFTIFKATDKKNEKSPDYNISIKVGEKWINIGGAWIRESNGKKFFSCKLSDAYGERNGFHITEDKKEEQKVHGTVVYPETISADSIPF